MASPDFRSRLVLRLSGLQRNSLRDSYRGAGWEKRLLFVNSLSTTSLVSQEIFFSKLWDGSVRRLKRFLARLPGFCATGESAIFRPVSICINACLKWASYEMPLADPRSGHILNE